MRTHQLNLRLTATDDGAAILEVNEKDSQAAPAQIIVMVGAAAEITFSADIVRDVRVKHRFGGDTALVYDGSVHHGSEVVVREDQPEPSAMRP